MIVGVGIDICSVTRFEAMLERHHGVLTRLLHPAECQLRGKQRSTQSLAARFAAKEALAKALGAPGNLSWLDSEVIADENGQPRFTVHGSVEHRANQLGVTGVHLSLSHDAGLATAIVIAEGD